jgi:hypothetical protein
VENILKLFLNISRLFLDLKKSSVVMELNCGTRYLNAIDAYNMSLCNCRGRGSKVEDRKSRVENSCKTFKMDKNLPF